MIRRPRLRLRARLVVGFGLAAITVTALLTSATWQLATDYTLEQRKTGATNQTQANARLVDVALRDESAPGRLLQLLSSLNSEPESASYVGRDGRWLGPGASVDIMALPSRLRTLLAGGTAARQVVETDVGPVLAVGLPLADGTAYVEMFPLRELDRTFRFLSITLWSGVALSGLVGAGLGAYASGRALRPLAELNAAASRIADGELHTRLRAEGDPDLQPLAVALNGTADRLQRRVERDARFAGDVSHELRSPVTTMLNALAVLQRRQDTMDTTAAAAVDLLDVDMRRFRHLIDDLLEISAVDRGRERLQLERLDLAEVTRHALITADLAHVPLVAEPVELAADRRRLERVVVNLVENAERHGHGAVEVRVCRFGGRARLEVDDAGPGVPPSEHERIFERFARGSSRDRSPDDTGTGLGLALVAEHVRLHGGRVAVNDRPGGGARFVVELPVEPEVGA